MPDCGGRNREWEDYSDSTISARSRMDIRWKMRRLHTGSITKPPLCVVLLALVVWE